MSSVSCFNRVAAKGCNVVWIHFHSNENGLYHDVSSEPFIVGNEKEHDDGELRIQGPPRTLRLLLFAQIYHTVAGRRRMIVVAMQYPTRYHNFHDGYKRYRSFTRMP